jgi:hypothetical protein
MLVDWVLASLPQYSIVNALPCEMSYEVIQPELPWPRRRPHHHCTTATRVADQAHTVAATATTSSTTSAPKVADSQPRQQQHQRQCRSSWQHPPRIGPSSGGEEEAALLFQLLDLAEYDQERVRDEAKAKRDQRRDKKRQDREKKMKNGDANSDNDDGDAEEDFSSLFETEECEARKRLVLSSGCLGTGEEVEIDTALLEGRPMYLRVKLTTAQVIVNYIPIRLPTTLSFTLVGTFLQKIYRNAAVLFFFQSGIL